MQKRTATGACFHCKGNERIINKISLSLSLTHTHKHTHLEQLLFLYISWLTTNPLSISLFPINPSTPYSRLPNENKQLTQKTAQNTSTADTRKTTMQIILTAVPIALDVSISFLAWEMGPTRKNVLHKHYVGRGNNTIEGNTSTA